MGKKEIPRQKGRLNIIFFMDGAKTRQIRVPLFPLVALFTFAFIFFIWGMTSGYWINMLFERNQKLETRLKETLRNLLSYELTQGEVDASGSSGSELPKQDKAEANSETVKKSAASPAGTKTVPQNTPIKASPSETPPNPTISHDNVPLKSGENIKKINGDLVSNAKEVTQADTPSANMSTAPQVEQKGVSIEQVNLNEGEYGVQLAFNLRNLDKTDKQSGFINIIAKFETSTGIAFTSIPPNLTLTDNGETREFHKGDTFSLKRFVRRNYTLPIPSGGAQRINEVKIQLITEDGQKFTQIIPGFALKNSPYGMSH